MAEDEDTEELKKELKKLNPRARLKRLKDMEGKKKEEIIRIEDLIKDSEKQVKTEKVAEEIAPKQTRIDLSKLFEEAAGRLEATVKKEAPETERETITYISVRQLYNDYSQLQNIAYASMMGSLTSSHMEAVDKIGERLDNTKYESVGKEVANILVASRATLYKIKKYAGLEGRSNY